MNGDDTARLISAGLMIMLVASSLFGRQLKLGETLRMALIWLALFAVIFVLFLFREEARAVWSRVATELTGQEADPGGRTLRVPMRDDGHFWVTGSVNGQPVDFMVDSGATTTALSADVARSAGIDVATNSPLDRSASPVRARRSARRSATSTCWA